MTAPEEDKLNKSIEKLKKAYEEELEHFIDETNKLENEAKESLIKELAKKPKSKKTKKKKRPSLFINKFKSQFTKAKRICSLSITRLNSFILQISLKSLIITLIIILLIYGAFFIIRNFIM